MLPLASLLLLAAAIGAGLLTAFAAHRLLRQRAATGMMSRHLPTVGRVGVQLAASVAIALAAFGIFLEVADNVIDRDELFHIDAVIASTLEPLRGAGGLGVARVVSLLGLSLTLTIFAAVLAATAYRRNWRAVGVGWILLFGGGKLVEFLLKHLFHRTRPAGAQLETYSYPSGHAMGAMIGYGLLAYLLLLRTDRPATRVAITAGAALVILAVGASRLVLGVHYFTDVAGGFAAGATWLLLAIAALEAERAWWRIDTARQPGAPVA